MSIKIKQGDVSPMTKKEHRWTLVAAILLSASVFVVPYPLAILPGLAAYVCWWSLLGDLFAVAHNQDHSPYNELRAERQESMNKVLPIVLIGVPSVLTILALIILVCYN